MRILHYPPQPPTKVVSDGRQIGIGSHTECVALSSQFVFLTIIYSYEVGFSLNAPRVAMPLAPVLVAETWETFLKPLLWFERR